MAFNVAERVKETTTTTGTGVITLSGAYPSFQTFLAGIGANNTTYYCIADEGGNKWEVGIGTVLSGPARLQRDTVLRSSDSNGLVNFGSGPKDVFVPYPAARQVSYGPDNYDLFLSASLAIAANTGVTGSLTVLGNSVLTTVTGSAFKGDGSQLTGVVSSSYTTSSSYALSGSYTVSSSYAMTASAARYAAQSETATTSSFASSILASGVTPGTMSGDFFINGKVTIPGTASIGLLQYAFTTSSIIYSSGSTKFGDTLDDIHQFTGSVSVTGSLSSTSFTGDGSGITGVISSSHALRSVSSSYADNAGFANTAATASVLTLPNILTQFDYSVPLAATYGQKIQITNFPSASTELDSSLRIKYDLTQVASASIGARIERSGSANAQLRMEYSLNDTNWFPLDGLQGPVLSVASLGTNVGTKVSITAAARTSVSLRIVTVQGDGTSTVEIGSITAQFTSAVPLYASANTSVGYKQVIPFISQFGGAASVSPVPSAVQEISSNLRIKYDLSKFASASVAAKLNTSGSSGSLLAVQYSTDEITWNYLDGVKGPNLSIGAGTGSLIGTEVGLSAGAKNVVVLRVVTLQGDSTGSAEFGNINLVVNSSLPMYAVNDGSTSSMAYSGSQNFVMSTAVMVASASTPLTIERTGGTAGTTGKTYILHSNFGYTGGTGADSILQSDWGFGIQVNKQSGVATSSLVITNGGRVGIGTFRPRSQLDVFGGYVRTQDDVTREVAFVQGFDSAYFGNLNSSGSVTFYQNNTNAMVISGSGNVGIGTNTPAALLHLSGSGNVAVRFTNGGANGNWHIGNSADSFAITQTGVDTRLFISSSGQVGVGTTTPTRRLTVYEAAATSRILIQNGNTGTSIGDGLDLLIGTDGNAGVWNYETGSLRFATSNLERMTINMSGNVGIGTGSSDWSLLTINAPTVVDQWAATGSTPNGMLMFSQTATGVVTTMGMDANVASQYFWIQPRHRSVVTYYNTVLNPNGGNVGIGMKTPVYNLHISASGGGRVGFTRGSSGKTWMVGPDTNPAGFYLAHDQTAGVVGVFMSDAGNIGIGTASPGYPFHVSASATVFTSYIENRNVGAYGLGIKVGGTSNAQYAFDIENGTAGNSIFRVYNDGQTVLNQDVGDGEILTLRSSDVAHGMTDFTNTNTYLYVKKESGTDGGARIHAFADGTTGVAVVLRGTISTGADVNKTTTAGGILYFDAGVKNGTGITGLAANGNIASFSTNGTTRFILDADGDSHQDVGTAWTNFDTHDDVQLLNLLSAHVTRQNDPLRENFKSWLEQSRDELERVKLVKFNNDGHHFVNMSRLSMLHTGAIRQIGVQVAELKQQLHRPTQTLLPETTEARIESLEKKILELEDKLAEKS